MKGLSALHTLATRSVIKQFANKHQLVYFGSVDARSDEHQLVRGVTAASTHVDSHYTVGTFGGHDLMFVERHNKSAQPNKAPVKHHWLILQLDLRVRGLPHIFIDSHHDETFHYNLRLGHAKLRDITTLVPSVGHLRVMAPVENLDSVQALFGNDFAAAMHSFNHFDYEINDDQVYVYAHNPLVTAPLLTDMLRVGVWLADYLDSVKL